MKKNIWIIIIAALVIFGIVGGVVVRSLIIHRSNDDVYSIREAAHLLQYINMAGGNDIQTDMAEYYDGVEDEEPFTAGNAREILEYFDLSYDDRLFELSKVRDKKALSREEFLIVFDFILDNKPNSGISMEQVLIIDVKQVDNDGSDNKDVAYKTVAVTEDGNYNIDADVTAENIDEVIDAYIYNNTIIENLGKSDKAVRLCNVWIENTTDEITFFYSGIHKSYKMENIVSAENTIADIVVNNNGVSSITLKGEKISAKVLAVTDEGIVLEGYDELLALADDYKIYKVYGELASERTSKILVGYNTTEFVMVDGVIQAALIVQEPVVTDIRVAINTTDYTSLIHNEVVVSSDSDMNITYGNNSVNIPAGMDVTIVSNSEYLTSGDRCVIKSVAENGKITIKSITRGQGNPSYRGSIELAKYDGGMVVINEVSLEEYLYGVVPSEMPASYGIEALKAQAMCARGYAYNAMLNNETYARYGAHLDDSQSSQVYNNTIETENTTFAVKDTYGVVPVSNGKIISSYFFSTSCGTTCNIVDVWGGDSVSYLNDNLENALADPVDLSDSDNFEMFINDSSGYNTIESSFPFYRWSATFTTEAISTAVNSTLKDRMKANPDNFVTISPDGDFSHDSIDTIGTVTRIEVNKRGKSGIILEMTIYGTENSVKVYGQTNARAIITPIDVDIVKQDGSTATGWPSLPSAFYYVRSDGDNFTIYGGGFGHGVGMSQNGAKALADLGYNAEYILGHYYTGSTLMYIYSSGDSLKKEDTPEATQEATTETDGTEATTTEAGTN